MLRQDGGEVREVLWLGVQQANVRGHSCGLGRLDPVRWRMQVPAGVRGHQRASLDLIFIFPYHIPAGRLTSGSSQSGVFVSPVIAACRNLKVNNIT